MSLKYTHAGIQKVVSLNLALYQLTSSVPASGRMYLDRIAAVDLAKAIDKLSPRPKAVEVMYLTYLVNKEIYYPNSTSIDDDYINRLSNSIFQHIKSRNGRDLYRIQVPSVLQYIERTDLWWTVSYEPGVELDALFCDIQEQDQQNLNDESTQIWQYLLPKFPLDNLDNDSFLFHPTVAPQQLYLPPQPFMVHQTPAAAPNGQSQETFFTVNSSQPESTIKASPSQQETLIESGCTTPTERMPFQIEIDSIMQEMRRQNNQRNAFVSQFALAESQAIQDNQAALQISSKMKVLALNPRIDKFNKNQFSIHSEKQAIKAMTINTSLNTGVPDSPLFEKLNRLFVLYNNNDEEGNESFQKGLLMIVVSLSRYEFMYNSNKGKKKQIGNYATDFEKEVRLPSGYLRRANHLCRMVVACGHPCILIVLIRLAIRNRITLSTLVDQLPIHHFCRFISNGKVTDFNFDSDEEKDTTHKDLQWLHGNVFLPLLQVASRRVPEQLTLVNGSLTCDEDIYLRAIVHNSKQIKYAHFLAGNHINAEWARGKVLVENTNTERQTEAEYTIEKHQRTIHRFKLAQYSHTDHFDNPPKFLQSKTLEMNLDL